MKLTSKPLMVGGHKLSEYATYSDINPDFLPTEKGIRVIPAPFFGEKSMYFTLLSIHAPGDKAFPHGGYSLREQNSGGCYSYELDQVIRYPQTPAEYKIIKSMSEGTDDDTNTRGRKPSSEVKEPKTPGGRRGRPAMDPEKKATLLAARAVRAQSSNGLRGRPSNPNPQPKQAYIPTGGSRGRKPLSPEERLKRQEVREYKPTGGKRGRPSKSN
jgi:hypothetical protein